MGVGTNNSISCFLIGNNGNSQSVLQICTSLMCNANIKFSKNAENVKFRTHV